MKRKENVLLWSRGVVILQDMLNFTVKLFTWMTGKRRQQTGVVWEAIGRGSGVPRSSQKVTAWGHELRICYSKKALAVARSLLWCKNNLCPYLSVWYPKRTTLLLKYPESKKNRRDEVRCILLASFYWITENPPTVSRENWLWNSFYIETFIWNGFTSQKHLWFSLLSKNMPQTWSKCISSVGLWQLFALL